MNTKDYPKFVTSKSVICEKSAFYLHFLQHCKSLSVQTNKENRLPASLWFQVFYFGSVQVQYLSKLWVKFFLYICNRSSLSA